MHAETYRTPEGGYFWHDTQTEYEDVEDFLSARSNFCLCGKPEDGLKYLAKLLRAVDERWHTQRWKDQELVATVPQQWFLLYMLDSFGLTYHVGSVEYANLTPDGRDLLEDIEELYGLATAERAETEDTSTAST